MPVSSIDMHMHSECSDDGTYTSEQLADMCIAKGLRVFAIADHDNVNAIGRAVRYCEGKEIEIIPAIELNCMIDGIVIHMLGYGIDHKSGVFADVWEDVLGRERIASKKRLEKIRALGIEFDDARIEGLSKWGVVTGEMIGEAAMEYDKGHENPVLRPYYEGGTRSDNPYVNFFWDFCSQGKPAFGEIKFMTVEEAVRVIRGNGGVPVLAHPGHSTSDDRVLLDRICAAGIQGLEVYSSYHTRRQTELYKAYVEEKGLISTCGSDFHGKTKPAIEIGSVGCGGREDEILEALGVSPRR